MVEAGDDDFSPAIEGPSSKAIRCVLQGNLKVFARAIMALAKVGDELLLEPTMHGLTLRAVNLSKSAYGCYLFSPSFFVEYEGGCGADMNASTADADESALCKISMKCAMSVFKAPQFMEKAVRSCLLNIDPSSDTMSVEMSLKYGVVKSYNIPFMTCGPGLRPMFDKSLAQNCIIDDSKCVLSALNNFGASTEEVTIGGAASELLIRNHLESEPDRSRVVKTEITLSKQDFERFAVSVFDDVTLCLKEFKAILVFADSLSMPVSFYFDSPGKPFMCSLESDMTFTGDFVIATLADLPGRASVQRRVAVGSNSQASSATSLAGGCDPLNSSAVENDRASSAVTRSIAVPRVLRSEQSIETLLSDPQTVSTKTVPETLLHSAHPPVRVENDPPPAAQVDSLPPTEVDDGISDTVAGTPPPSPPPNKRFRSFFLGLSQQTFHASQIYRDAEVLAPDSDPEET
uniref:Cell cycle checkpoint control protein n=1 Tax=Plectus sambesii TaxID=2011161 RepID=A0A914XLS1_9BILA